MGRYGDVLWVFNSSHNRSYTMVSDTKTYNSKQILMLGPYSLNAAQLTSLWNLKNIIISYCLYHRVLKRLCGDVLGVC